MDLALILTSYFGAIEAVKTEMVQKLWSGYGEIARYELSYVKKCSGPKSIIVQWISPPKIEVNPRGWSSEQGHQRKLRSYQVEANWYQDWVANRDDMPNMPQCYGVIYPDKKLSPDNCVIVMSDLNAQGYSVRPDSLSLKQAKPCVQWLAQLHAANIKNTHISALNINVPILEKDRLQWPQGLWPIGCYWHLGTRQAEFTAMAKGQIKDAANIIDDKLNQCHYKTLVHGDAKLANFCFNHDVSQVAAVDFQYIGAGCGIRDLAYFIGSALNTDQLEAHYDTLVDLYFNELNHAIKERAASGLLKQTALDLTHLENELRQIETEWRYLLPIAWADFQRFLLGWAPNHWKNNHFAQAMTDRALLNISS